MNRNFRELLEARWAEGKFVCVGLDTDPLRVPIWSRVKNPTITIRSFNAEIVAATHDLVCAYKPNIAFYESYGNEGILALQLTIAHIQRVAPEVPVILDAKRGDIGNTNEGYLRMAFDFLNADAITLHPYLGMDSLEPFLDRKNKGLFILCRTSNPGAGEFQDMDVIASVDEEKKWGIGDGDNLEATSLKLYEYVALRVAHEWNKNKNCALVVGATCPDELHQVRKLVDDMPILIPGVGAQGGDLQKTVEAGKDSRGRGMIINLSRSVLYASKERDFAEAARREVEKNHNLITQYLI